MKHTKVKYSEHAGTPCGGLLQGFCGHVNHQAAERDGSPRTGHPTGHQVSGRGCQVKQQLARAENKKDKNWVARYDQPAGGFEVEGGAPGMPGVTTQSGGVMDLKDTPRKEGDHMMTPVKLLTLPTLLVIIYSQHKQE